MTFPIAEIFDSIQGEGCFVGVPATFIRFAGCNLKCEFCDTNHKATKEMTVNQIAREIHYPNIIFTGGEPTLYDLNAFHFLVTKKIGGSRCYIHVETNGTNPVPDWVSWVTCSPKLETNYQIAPKHVDELKFIVNNKFQIEHIFQAMSKLSKQPRFVWLQPQDNDPEFMKRVYNLILEYPSLRAGFQLHKIYKVM